MRRGAEFEPDGFPDEPSSGRQERIGDIHRQAAGVLEDYWDRHRTRRNAVRLVGVSIAVAGVGGLLVFGRVGELLASVDCNSAEILIGSVEYLENLGHWKAAAATAEFGLQRKGLCLDARLKLGKKFASNALEFVYEQEVSPLDIKRQEELVLTYTKIQDTVRRYALPDRVMPGKLQIARRAHSVKKFLLAKRALDEASYIGDIQKDQGDDMRLAYSIWRNAGYYFVESKMPEYRDRGIQMLVGAYHLDTSYGLRSGVARNDLVTYLGQNEADWPSPQSHPLLALQSSPTSTPRVEYGRNPMLEIRNTDNRR